MKGETKKEVEDEIERVNRSYEICAKSGQPYPEYKISMSHLNQAFNQEIRLDYTYCNFKGTKMVVLQIVDAGTAY